MLFLVPTRCSIAQAICPYKSTCRLLYSLHSMETNERLVIFTIIICSCFTYEKTEIQQVTCHRSRRRQGTDFVNQDLLISNSAVFSLHLCMLSHFSCVWLCVILKTIVAHHVSLSMGFSRKEYWSALLFPPPRDLPNPGIEPTSHYICCCLLFSCSVMSDSLGLHGLQYARPPCPSPTPRVCSNSCPLTQWCHPTISSSVIPFSSCLPSFPASRSFPISQLFTSDDQSIGASALASVLPFHLDVHNSKTFTVLVSRSFFPFL